MTVSCEPRFVALSIAPRESGKLRRSFAHGAFGPHRGSPSPARSRRRTVDAGDRRFGRCFSLECWRPTLRAPSIISRCLHWRSFSKSSCLGRSRSRICLSGQRRIGGGMDAFASICHFRLRRAGPDPRVEFSLCK